MTANSQSTPGASAPGFPGTVIETAAPAAAIHVPPTDTSAMTPSQARAARFVDSLKPSILDGSVTPLALRQNREALDHIFHGAGEPAWLREQSAEEKTQAQADGAHPADAEGDAFGALLEPMAEADVATIATRGVVAGGLPREVATEAAELCQRLELPKVTAEGLVDRLAHHAREGWSGDLSDDERAELGDQCIRMLGGPEKAEREAALARKYIESVGGAALLAEVDKRAGSLGFDPRLILQFSMLARARGLDT